jgi:hypothetical protein
MIERQEEPGGWFRGASRSDLWEDGSVVEGFNAQAKVCYLCVWTVTGHLYLAQPPDISNLP